MVSLVKIIGALGIFLISLGIIAKKRKMQDLLYVGGGICLEAYSIFISDIIFMVLQMIFISAALYDFFKIARG